MSEPKHNKPRFIEKQLGYGVPITQIIYMSRCLACDEDNLRAIWADSRKSNEQSHITGMLLYASGHFLQVLEGEKSNVTLTFERICNDPRHEGVFKLDELVVQQRQFADWAMGFETVSHPGITAPTDFNAFFNITDENIAQRVQPGIAYKAL